MTSPEKPQENLKKPEKSVVRLAVGVIVSASILAILILAVSVGGAYLNKDIHKDDSIIVVPYTDSQGRFEHVRPVLKGKPIIYLYPQKQEHVQVRLDFSGSLVATYPEYDEKIHGWDVIANPNGDLTDTKDGKPYSYLFWEGESDTAWDLSAGFVVKGSDTRAFLQTALAKLGLSPREYNEFIVYWYPRMKDNAYNLVHFAGEEYTSGAPLTITPAPDSMLRVFMVFKPLDKHMDIPEQKIIPFERKGFSVVEWGGTELEK